MRHHILLATILAAASPAAAQTAVGVSVGASVPTVAGLGTGVHVAGSIERSVMEALSIRADVGFAWLSDAGGPHTAVRPLNANVDIAYKLRRGGWFPYVTGGIGFYRYSATFRSAVLLDPKLRADLIALGLGPTSASIKEHESGVGANIGAGIEVAMTARISVVGDVRYHRVGSFGFVAPYNGSFVSASAGFKRYF